jgi:hypothetical protein
VATKQPEAKPAKPVPSPNVKVAAEESVMAISVLEKSVVDKGMLVAKKLLLLKSVVDELNVLYDADDLVKETLTQGDLDGVSEWSGITKANVDDGMYAITAGLRILLNDAHTQLAILSGRKPSDFPL